MRRVAILVILLALFTGGASLLVHKPEVQFYDPPQEPFTGQIEVSAQDIERTCHAIRRSRSGGPSMQSRGKACLAYIEALRYNREILADS